VFTGLVNFLSFFNNNNNNLTCKAPVCAKKTSVALKKTSVALKKTSVIVDYRMHRLHLLELLLVVDCDVNDVLSVICSLCC